MEAGIEMACKMAKPTGVGHHRRFHVGSFRYPLICGKGLKPRSNLNLSGSLLLELVVTVATAAIYRQPVQVIIFILLISHCANTTDNYLLKAQAESERSSKRSCLIQHH
jgi:hypothetical protein